MLALGAATDTLGDTVGANPLPDGTDEALPERDGDETALEDAAVLSDAESLRESADTLALALGALLEEGGELPLSTATVALTLRVAPSVTLVVDVSDGRMLTDTLPVPESEARGDDETTVVLDTDAEVLTLPDTVGEREPRTVTEDETVTRAGEAL